MAFGHSTRKVLVVLLITQRIPAPADWQVELELPFELRQKSRLRTRASNGEELALFIERGTVLRGGDLLQSQDGRVVKVVAKAEAVLHVTATSPTELARVAYHLGNRHVPLQVGDGFLRILDDYVLAAMLDQLRAVVMPLAAPFEPETGAYGGGHHHSHGNSDVVSKPRIHEFQRVTPCP